MGNTVGRLARTLDRRYQIAEGGRIQESSENECSADATTTDNNEWAALMTAARGGQIDVVRCLVDDCGADVNTKDSDGRTALMRAATEGHIEVVLFLVIDCGTDVNMKDNDGRAALIWAARGGHIDVLRFLVDACGADVNTKDNEGWTPLIWAATEGHIEVVRCLVDDCGADVNTKDSDGGTALIWAARGGHIDVLRFLVNVCGANRNTKDNDGVTALMRAAREGHIDVARFLVDACGADVNTKNNEGWTPLIWASIGGHIEVVRFLANDCGAVVNTKDSEGRTALIWAASGGHIDVLRFLVNVCGANVNTKDSDGVTALMRAGRGGQIDVARFLVNDCGADVNTKDNSGRAALIWASIGGHIDVLRFLVDACGADVNTKDSDGRTALMRAATEGHIEVVLFLVIDCGADVNTKDSDGRAALIWAARGGHIDVLRFLVNVCGANLNTKDNDGVTALMRAAREGHIDVARFLVDACGADMNTKDNEGWTPLIWASIGGHIEVVRFLVSDCGANVNVKSEDGYSATRFAADHGYYDIVRLLTPFVVPDRQTSTNNMGEGAGNYLLTLDRSSSSFIPPFEVELGEFCRQGDVGGDFRAKWLDADAVVKLFIPDASHSTLEREVRVWQQLRHPNVLKLYGVSQAGSDVSFFVCEYASQGSLTEYANTLCEYSFGEGKPPSRWKYLHGAALGLAYLHERGIIHGDLRCSNILVGSDGMAKLSNFGLTGSATELISVGVVGSTRWQSPEVLEGNPPSRESDIYSLGMCILEAESGKKPWNGCSECAARKQKMAWNLNAHDDDLYDTCDVNNPGARVLFIKTTAPYFARRSRELVWWMCCQDPHKRPCLPSIVSELEQLAFEESSDGLEATCSIDEYLFDQRKELWVKLQTCMNECDNVQHRQIFDKLTNVYDRLRESKRNERLLDQFYSLLTDAYQTVTMTPEQARILRLSSTRATMTSIYSFNWRVDALLKAMGESTSEETKTSWQQQHHVQAADFVSSITDTVLLLQDLKSVEEKTAFLQMLKVEIATPQEKYTGEQLETMKKTYEEIEGRLGNNGDAANLTPEWFIPWYELFLDKGNHLGAGSFGSVCRAKWLDSDVVVKQVMLPGSDRNPEGANSFDSFFESIDQSPLDPQTAAKRTEAQTMFRREADIWFGFSHPHVVRLFGACHIGRPFFVCEYATHGTLDKYLRKHPDELWTKLREAALGVQYLHARGVVHGDLKGNNIVIGSDLKAKVTDFGLSSLADSEDSSPISGALHWVAPECLVDKNVENARPKTTFESDVYSLGMCIVEALRVVEAIKTGKPSYGCLPWGVIDIVAVKYHVRCGKLPPRPECEDGHWELIQRMCAAKPEERIKISTVVDGLERLATDTDTQANDVTDRMHSVNHESVDLATAEARKLLAEWRSDTEQHNASLVMLYDSLWDRIKSVDELIAEGDHDAACWSAFHSLVVEARASTANLKSTGRDLISLTQATMRCYALCRRLDKLSDVALVCRARRFRVSKDDANLAIHDKNSKAA